MSSSFSIPLDEETVSAKGTPLQKLKIGNTILDTVGGTPIVSNHIH